MSAPARRSLKFVVLDVGGFDLMLSVSQRRATDDVLLVCEKSHNLFVFTHTVGL